MSNNTEKPRDGWSKAEALAGILLPLLVALGGGAYTLIQDRHNEAALLQQKQREQLVTRSQQIAGLLQHLASDKPRERLLAVTVAQQLASDALIPSELMAAIAEIAQNDESAEVAGAATALVTSTTTVSTVSPEGVVGSATSRAATALKEIAPRVYLHIRTEEDRAVARAISGDLQQVGFLVPGIEKLDGGPSQSELRYFEGSIPEDTRRILATLKEAGLDASAVDLTQRYKGSTGIRPRHYELWIARGAVQPASGH